MILKPSLREGQTPQELVSLARPRYLLKFCGSNMASREI